MSQRNKISKNRSDAEMTANYQEELTFENTPDEETPGRPVSGQPTTNFAADFFPPALQEKVGRALLEVKLALYKQGITDFNLKVSRDDTKVILSAVPLKPKKPAAKRKE